MVTLQNDVQIAEDTIRTKLAAAYALLLSTKTATAAALIKQNAAVSMFGNLAEASVNLRAASYCPSMGDAYRNFKATW